MGELVLRTVVLAALVGGCTKHVNQCTSDSDCTDPAYPFCDVNGEFPASGGTKNICTVTPTNCPVDRCGCTPGATTCGSDTLLTCNADGKSQTMTSCALGCATDGTRCLTFEPSNGLGPALAAAGGEPDVVLPKGVHIDTGTGTITNSGGIAIPVQSLVVTEGGSAIRAFYAKSFVIDDATVTGPDAVAFVAAGDVTVQGAVDASGTGLTGGPGAQASTAACSGHSGQSQPCEVTFTCDGGGGAGNATAGTSGGGGTGAAGAAQTGFAPLVGGCPGGSGLDSSGALVGSGGGGGGAMQLVSATRIVVTGSALIDVGAGGGDPFGGGGSGGNIVLEAPQVSIEGAAAIVGNGGAGGGCSASGPDATRDMNPAVGPGPCGNHNTDGGGSGGTVTVAPTTSGHQGGGGGAVGRLRIATKNGTAAVSSSALLSVAVTNETLTSQ